MSSADNGQNGGDGRKGSLVISSKPAIQYAAAARTPGRI